jgi:lipoprotein-anchoring transpeptidase ErfK/SrfK
MLLINKNPFLIRAATVASIASVLFTASGAIGGPLNYAPPFQRANSIFNQVLHDRGIDEDQQNVVGVPAHLRRQVGFYKTREMPGTIIIDTSNTQLYFVLTGGKAIRYGIGVGREGFTWSGVQNISRKTEWPDWIPPAEMLQRQPYLPRFMAGGPGNPLGARAMYLGGTMYRIHGTNAPATIGGRVSSGCIRMLNEDVVDLYERVNIGTKVVVLPAEPNPRPSSMERNREGPEAKPIVTTNKLIQAFGLY